MYLYDQIEVGQLAQVLVLERPRLRPALGRQQAMAGQLLDNLGLYVGVLADAVPACGAHRLARISASRITMISARMGGTWLLE